MKSEKLRLDRFLSSSSALSRKQAQQAIRDNQVRVDGQLVGDPAAKVSGDSTVTFRDERVAARKRQYFMMNKPAGYICAASDDRHPTVLTLLHVPFQEELHFAGRLDLDTTGLVLITDDGAWSHRITSPRWKCSKRYLVSLENPLSAAARMKLEQGVLLKSEKKPTRPALVEILSAGRVGITVQEGRYHQVKRMFAAVGNRVLSLHRASIGNIILDAELAEGEYRPLSREEIGSVENH